MVVDAVVEACRCYASLVLTRLRRRWLLAVCLVVLVPVACGKVDESPDGSFACDQSVASYCASQFGGCPSSEAPEDICRWLSLVGGDQRALSGGPIGYPLQCGELPERKDFNVAVDDSARSYVFVRGSLYYVFEASPTARCVGGPQHVAKVACTKVDFLDILPCAAYATDGGVE